MLRLDRHNAVKHPVLKGVELKSGEASDHAGFLFFTEVRKKLGLFARVFEPSLVIMRRSSSFSRSVLLFRIVRDVFSSAGGVSTWTPSLK
jgi:hypothetical protein